ncbi:hypothetical protein MT325_m220R [Paramecium bursaria chlorella virus MT325]|uniref:Uncharacterized protein m220R n=1 Tax=Paramecium bursaria Chlorella virus MT325 TaxID=346932 RepID=A7ITV0_PBCVM|nr:hypothetical protein MT325_m220R [Paramecium bursaria chlorella virus MT325]
MLLNVCCSSPRTMSIHRNKFSPESIPKALPKFFMSKFGRYVFSVNFFTMVMGSLLRAIPAATMAPAEVPATIFSLFSCPVFFSTCMAPRALMDFAPPPARTRDSG